MQRPKLPVLLIITVYETLCGHWCCLGQVLYLGRAPRTKETLPDFRERCRVNRHSRVFHGLTGCQRTPQFWGVTKFQHIFVDIVILSNHINFLCFFLYFSSNFSSIFSRKNNVYNILYM